MRRLRGSFGLAAALALAACRSSGGDANEAALARFDGRVLTVRDFEEHLASLPPQIRARYASTEAREKLLADMVRLELLAGEARRRGVDRSPRIQARVSELLVEEMMNGLFGSETAEAAKVTEDEIRRYHEAHAAEFSSPEERRASDVVFTDRTSAEAFLRKPSGEKREGSDLGFFSATSANRPPDAIREAVFRLAHAGDVTDVVAGDGKFHVLTLTGIRPALVRTVDDARTFIRGRIAEEKRREAAARFTDELVKGAHVETHRELLPRAASSATAPEPEEAP